MPPNPPGLTRNCRDELIESFRDKILEVATPKHSNITGRKEIVLPRRQFYPEGDLRKIFGIEDVLRILNHRCADCSNHLPANHPGHPSQNAEKVLKTHSSINLFALLVFLRHPLLIGIFLSTYDLDTLPLPRYFSEFDLRDRLFKHLPPRSSNQLAADFQEQKWHFAVPIFTDNTFQNYHEGTIMPYLDEVPIGSGGYGRVFKVWVHPDYCTLSSVQIASTNSRNPGAKVFVRKEMRIDDAVEYEKEISNLEQIATLKDPHLVQIRKAYQLGDKFNILFPCAKTNLFEYLRNPVWRAPQVAQIPNNPLWEQVLGMTKALSKIINFVIPDEPTQTIFGYHCDIKPQNILIDNSAAGSRDVFKITDFGQAKFLNVSTAGTDQNRSHIQILGGTDAYAPPEIEDSEQDRVYDVWSLAIIVLEVLVYTIRSVDGLEDPEKGLDNIRCTREGRQTNARFYTFVDSVAIVKPKIRKFIEDLSKDPSIEGERNQQFVQSLCQLIMLMLEPLMKRRIKIDHVVTEMAKIFQMKPSEAVDISVESSRIGNEKVLVDLTTVDYYPRGIQGRQSTRVNFFMLENDMNILRTFIDRPLVPPKDDRRQMKLILNFQHAEDYENDNYEISFAAMENNAPVSLDGQSIAVNDRNAAKRLQMALTGHVVSERYQLVGMELKDYNSPLQEAKSKIKSLATRGFRSSKGKEPSASDKVPVPLWIELWMEKLRDTCQIVPSKSSTTSSEQVARRANRQTRPGQKVPLGRVVIYCTDRILMLPFERECKLAKQENMKVLRAQNITFKPMDTRQCEFFRASWLLPSGDEQLPGVPMHHQSLYKVEEDSSFKCESILLKFEKPEDAFAFYKMYKTQKGIWLDGVKGKQTPHNNFMLSD